MMIRTEPTGKTWAVYALPAPRASVAGVLFSMFCSELHAAERDCADGSVVVVSTGSENR